VVALLREANELVAGWDAAGLGDAELLAVTGAVEVEKRRLAVLDHRLVGEIDARGLGHGRGCADTKTLLMRLLRVDAGQARARVRAARDLGPRRSLSGQPLEPLFPLVAAAIGEGSISPAAARVIRAGIDALPAEVQCERGAQIEASLVEHARRFAPADVGKICRRLVDTYDQDGRLACDEDRARRRRLEVHQHGDGSVSGSFLLDPIAGQALLSALDPLAKPHPGPHGEKDPRTPAQRRHDALKTLLLAALRSGQLPDSGGISTTIVLTLTLEQFHQLQHSAPNPTAVGPGLPRKARAPGTGAGGGLVRTGHGALLALHEVSPLLGDAQITAVVLGSLKRIEAYGCTHRFFTPGQRLALHARDGGCSFPGCTVPPAWCQAHHVIDHAQGGRTNVDNGTLLCPYHHRHHTAMGYTCHMINGSPHWTAPNWIDPTQTPLRNTAHHVTDLLVRSCTPAARRPTPSQVRS
jgi:hypothetical protein